VKHRLVAPIPGNLAAHVVTMVRLPLVYLKLLASSTKEASTYFLELMRKAVDNIGSTS
jgi:hypothetical protein